ncbi:MAG: ATP-dependent zinc protease, partial [Pseudomonadales bacterium]|nr:ATP-dependent zinc protease [Pseudomonadales bacterium]
SRPLAPDDSELTPAVMGGAKVKLGWLQSIRLLPHKVRMTAKLDTGAKSSVIHAVDIKPFKKNTRRWVRFTVPIEKKKGLVEMAFELPVVSQSRVKQHHSEELDERYVVELDFCIAGKVYSANFSLDDREKFNYPVLLGRDFLQKFFIVDPAKTFINKYNCLPQSKG